MRLASSLVAAGLLALAACSAGTDATTAPSTEGAASSEGGLRLCAAVRGNGQYIVTHFASLARIVEHYGLVDAVAGGSSGSMSSFIYESIRKNPAVKGATPDETAARVALLLRSVLGYASEVADSPEGRSIQALAGLAPRLKAAFAEKGIQGLLTTDGAAAAREMLAILSNPDFRALVNPEALAMLQDGEHLDYNAKEIYASVATLGAFAVDDNRLFFRPGALSFDDVAAKVGRVGDFFAGYGPSDAAGMRAYLDQCAPVARGKTWQELHGIVIGSRTCGDIFGALVRDFRAKLPTASFASRIDEPVGGTVPALISTSVLTGNAVTAWQAGRQEYLSGAHPAPENIPFAPSWQDIRFGYWGRAGDLARVAGNPMHYTDAKTAKFLPLGQATWRSVLSISPAEPGLARFRELPGGLLSAGGWSDLHPVLVLKNLGCDKVVYVQREGDEGFFATKIAKYLGLQESDWSAVFDLANPDSGYSRSVSEADGVWCTNWNAFKDLEQNEMAADSNAPPFEVRSRFFADAEHPYPGRTDRAGKVGCTPGVSGGATYPR